MTQSIPLQSEHHRLEQIAADYRSEGYEVKVHPRPVDLPDFLAGFEPDLLASGNRETIVVEVKTRDQLTSLPANGALEGVLQNRPGWRFEMVIDGAEPELRRTLSAHQIRASMREASELQLRNHSTAALLLLWSATEGALRLLANREKVELEWFSAGYMMKRLYTLGMIGRKQYQTLEAAMRLRNSSGSWISGCRRSHGSERYFVCVERTCE